MSYRIKDVIENYKNKLKDNINEYITLLQVIGNNYKYSYNAQLNIYSVNPQAKACAEYNFWKNNLNRYVRKNEKGIPIYIIENGKREIKYIFDISQTETNKKSLELKLWKFEKENKIFNLTKEDFFQAKKDFIKSYFEKIKIENNDKIENCDIILEKSIIIAVNERLGIKEEILLEKDIYKNIIEQKMFFVLVKNVSKISNNILKDIEKNIKEKELEKSSNVRYIDGGKRYSQNENMEMISNDNRNNKRQEISSGERHIHSDSERDTIREKWGEIQEGNNRWGARNISTVFEREINTGGNTGRREYKRLGADESEIHGKREQRSTGRIDTGREIGRIFTGFSGDSSQIYRERETENDDILGTNRRTERKQSTKIQQANGELKLFSQRDYKLSINSELENIPNEKLTNFKITDEILLDKLTPSERDELIKFAEMDCDYFNSKLELANPYEKSKMKLDCTKVVSFNELEQKFEVNYLAIQKMYSEHLIEYGSCLAFFNFYSILI